MTPEPDWLKAYRGRFRDRFHIDPEAWERIMRGEVSGWTEYACMRAMEWMQSRWQQWPDPPNARDIANAMIEHAKGDGAEPTSRCDVCRGSGIATVYPDVPEGGFKTYDDFFRAYGAATPCACSAGDRAIARELGWSSTGRTPKLDRLAIMAVRQHAEIEQMRRDAPPADMDAPTVDALAGAVTQTFRDRDAGDE